MADHYGSSEEIVGWFKKLYPQHTIQALTKWVPEPGPISKETVRAAVHRALKRLQSEQIDLMQFHAWSYADPSWLDGLFFLNELKQEGLVRTGCYQLRYGPFACGGEEWYSHRKQPGLLLTH
jgi:aryl-alcohol dehydrogenase-like predicted oxidoreductase